MTVPERACVASTAAAIACVETSWPRLRIASPTVVEGTTVTFSGAQTVDPEGDALHYNWTILQSGSNNLGSATLENGSNLAERRITPDYPGMWKFKLTVHDDYGNTAEGTIAAIEAAGTGPAVHLETLFLRGDDAMGSRKDGRRARIAANYCVIALVGDNLGDFADVLNADESAIAARRAMVAHGQYAQLWGNGWFLMPNPVYGAWQKGSLDEVFPPETRWKPSPSDAPMTMSGQ